MRVTTKDLWMEIVKLRTDLGPTIQNAADVPDHENRLRSLERWRYGIPPAILGAIASVIATFWKR